MAQCFDLNERENMFWHSDPGWMMAPWLIVGTLMLGATMFLYDGAPDYPAPDRVWAMVARHRITNLALAPTVIRSRAPHGETWPCVAGDQKGVAVVDQFLDMSKVRVLDLSQDFSANSPAFARYEGPTMKWVKRIAFEGVNAQHLSSTIHLSTHLDSPWHFYDPGPDVAVIPLSKLFGPAVVVDLEKMGVGDFDLYGPEHFEAWEQKTGIRIQQGDTLIIHTGFHRYYNEQWCPCTCGETRADLPRYFLNQPGPSTRFIEWVLERGIRWMAIDAMSTDHPFDTVVRQVRPDVAEKVRIHLGVEDLDEVFPREYYQMTHTLLFPKGVFHVENLGGQIDEVLGPWIWVGCFPFRFRGGEAAWCRMLAFVPEE